MLKWFDYIQVRNKHRSLHFLINSNLFFGFTKEHFFEVQNQEDVAPILGMIVVEKAEFVTPVSNSKPSAICWILDGFLALLVIYFCCRMLLCSNLILHLLLCSLPAIHDSVIS